MRTFSEQQIAAFAPNANAVSNGRKISAGGGFVSRMRSADDSFYMGECKGSGKSNYVVSADFADEDHPVFRCSCPSRQFPCKHSLALMCEMAAGKDFMLGEIPADILDKREKKQAREKKKTESTGEKNRFLKRASGQGRQQRRKDQETIGRAEADEAVDRPIDEYGSFLDGKCFS